MRHDIHSQGFFLVLVLVMGSVFFLIISAFLGFVITQGSVQESKYYKSRALDIAEAGLNYYKWYLAHNPGDTTNGTGEPGPYTHPFSDPEGDEIGAFSLKIASSTVCGEVQAIDIESTGYTYEAPDLDRTIRARYARPTIAEYAYIINSNVWVGGDHTIIGPYHSNGIIRMDGTNNSIVTSGQESWVCDDSIPCDPADEGDTVDAVYGDGSGSALWQFPAAPINFTGLTVDLADIEAKAGTAGVSLEPSGAYGYRLHFNANGTVDVYKVSGTYNYFGYTAENGWQTERHVIQTDEWEANYPIPEGCPVIFVEDKVWLEGKVDGKVTIAAADIDTTGVSPSIILNDSITYADDDSGLLAIAEADVLIGLTVPDDMEINGIFIAQNGRFGRNHYTTQGSQDVESIHDAYVQRDTLTVRGTVVSNGRVGTKWVSGATFLSGFETRSHSYDRALVESPPPLSPHTSDTYEFVTWQEVE